MRKYPYHCSNCGFFSEEPTKEDWLIVKKDHKKGCKLEATLIPRRSHKKNPDEEDWVLVRRELALKLREESDARADEKMKEITEEKNESEKSDPTS